MAGVKRKIATAAASKTNDSSSAKKIKPTPAATSKSKPAQKKPAAVAKPSKPPSKKKPPVTAQESDSLIESDTTEAENGFYGFSAKENGEIETDSDPFDDASEGEEDESGGVDLRKARKQPSTELLDRHGAKAKPKPKPQLPSKQERPQEGKIPNGRLKCCDTNAHNY